MEDNVEPKSLVVNSAEWLEWQYQCSGWSKRNMTSEEVLKSWYDTVNEESERARNALSNKELNLPYASKERTNLDIFYPEADKRREDGPVLVFIPGGYWQETHKDNYSYLGFTFTNAGITTVIVGYDRAPKVTLDEIVDEVKDALVFIANKFPKSRLYLSGWSAGGHLTAVLLATDWTKCNLPKDTIQGAIILDGVFDIQPLVPTTVNDGLGLTMDVAKKHSPIFAKPLVTSRCKVLVVLADEESPELHRQSEEYVLALQQEGVHCEFAVVPGKDHFTVMASLADSHFYLTKKCVGFMCGDC